MSDDALCIYPGPGTCPDFLRDCYDCEYYGFEKEARPIIRDQIENVNLSLICPVNGILCPIMQELPIESRLLSVCFQSCHVREIIAEEFAL